MAAGIKVPAHKISTFTDMFESAVRQQLKFADVQPTLAIDNTLEFSRIDFSLLDELESLGPFGPGNPEPLFMAERIHILSQKIVGKAHRQMMLKQKADSDKRQFPAIHFNFNTREESNNDAPDDIIDRFVFRLRWNRWNSNKKIQLVVEDTEYFA
jgi:single-stranded-DNA-specific exonuclease